MNVRRMSLLLFVLLTFVSVRAEETSGSISAVLQPYVDSGALAGAVTAVVTRDKVHPIERVGYADITSKTPMKADTLFWIASMSKPLTGAALMMLVDEGKISLDDPLEKYLPEFKNVSYIAESNKEQSILKKNTKTITIRDCMAHISGLPFLARIEQKIDTYTLRESVIAYAMAPLIAEPHTKYLYSNCGIKTGGRIIEVVSGMPYEEFMETRLFKPLGMKDTTLWPSEEQESRLAKSYKPSADKTKLEEIQIQYLTYPLTNRKRGACPGGGYFSTAGDLALFAQMILNGGTLNGKKYLSEAAIKQMTSNQTGALDAGPTATNAVPKGSYGIGWSVGGNGYGHGGAYSTDLWIHADKGVATIWMVQHAGYGGKDGGKILPAFKKAALELVAKEKKQ
ncbi:MAG TPA: serine hydrolase domain-containing protein [Planctomycetota bacterium]|nr:serine hydrolase domain-containing protein [Planctomycetota bacterium]